MSNSRISLPDRWTSEQIEGAIELLELLLIDMWEQYDHLLGQLKHLPRHIDGGPDQPAPDEPDTGNAGDDIPF